LLYVWTCEDIQDRVWLSYHDIYLQNDAGPSPVLIRLVKLLLSNTARQGKKDKGKGKTLPLEQSWAIGGVLPIRGAQVCPGWVPTGQICQGWVPTAHPNLVSGPVADRRVSRLIRGVLLVGNMFPAHHAALLNASLPSIYCREDD